MLIVAVMHVEGYLKDKENMCCCNFVIQQAVRICQSRISKRNKDANEVRPMRETQFLSY